MGLLFRIGLLDGTSLALLELNTTFLKPVIPGDTVHCRVEVVGKRGTKKLDRGILNLRIQVLNQRQEAVLEIQHTTLQARITANT